MTIAEKLQTIAENEPRVYEAGRVAGFEEGQSLDYDEVYEQGRKSEYDSFWDAFQQNGERKSYLNGFDGHGWTDENFKPKYDMTPSTCGNMFSFSHIKDLKGALQKCGVTLDTKNSTTFNFMLNEAWVEKVGEIDITGATAGLTPFRNALNLISVDKLTVLETQDLTDAFANAKKLTEIRIGGTIGRNLNMQWCPLSVDSMKNIISCLKNYKGTDNDLSYTLTFGDARWSALEADSTSPNETTWKEYVNSLGWNT